MMKKITLTNFKCFEHLEVPLRQVNVLTGMNGMGKSTVIQSMLITDQSYNYFSKKNNILLNGDWICLGTGKDIMYEKGNEQEGISFSVEHSNGVNASWKAVYNSEEDSLEAEMVEPRQFFGGIVRYISAMRVQPKPFYNLSEKWREERIRNGEYYLTYLSNNAYGKVNNSSVVIGDKSDIELGIQLKRWLDLISPGISAHVFTNKSLNVAELKYEFIEGAYKTNSYKAVNVGFGITYVLPVIVALLTADNKDIIIIENPEAHLHPAGQRMMGELIARAGVSGAQLFIETHSDHLINGLRLAVRSRIIPKENVNLLYFSKNKDTFKHEMQIPKIQDDGKIDYWPEGFFDEWEKALFEFF